MIEPVDKVSVQSLNNNAGGKDNRYVSGQNNPIHIGIGPLGLFCNKPAVDIGRANYEGSSYTTG